MVRLLLIPLLIAILSSYVMARIKVAQSRADLTRRSRLLHHPAITAQCALLAQAMDVDKIQVLELDEESINGFADIDGRVFLTKGFMAQFASGGVTAQELASVIAHELGHVAHGHMRQRMRDVTGQQAATTLAAMMLSRFIPLIGPWLIGRLSGLFMAHISRKNEFEADTYASALLIKAGIGTAPQKSLFRKLSHLTAREGATIPAWARSHPTPLDRITAIEANEKRWLGQ